MLVRIRHPEKLIYPETDGQPMGENTIQVKWIIELFNGLQAVFRDRPDVFVAANLFWYPVHGDPTTVLAPDVMVALGRPKGDRPSYKQWEEGGVAPQAVFEVLSPGNTTDEMDNKRKFFRRYGVEEYYEYDPYIHKLRVWQRSGRKLVAVKDVNGFVSLRLGIRFAVPGTEPMTVFRPDGRPFRTYLQLLADAEAQQQRAAALAAKLRELGVDPDTV
jgi:Uma2 family endonuclease